MKGRLRRRVGALVFALSLLIGLPACVSRTGTFYCDTRTMLCGPSILVNGVSMWGSERKRDAFSTLVGGFMTLRLGLFSWWWDTLCIPYDVGLRFAGVDIYVYDENGEPLQGVEVVAEHEDSFFRKEAETDASGHFYFPRCVKSFYYLSIKKDGYVSYSKFDRWLRQNIGSDQAIIKGIESKGGRHIETTNNVSTLNVFMKKRSRRDVEL